MTKGRRQSTSRSYLLKRSTPHEGYRQSTVRSTYDLHGCMYAVHSMPPVCYYCRSNNTACCSLVWNPGTPDKSNSNNTATCTTAYTTTKITFTAEQSAEWAPPYEQHRQRLQHHQQQQHHQQHRHQSPNTNTTTNKNESRDTPENKAKTKIKLETKNM